MGTQTGTRCRRVWLDRIALVQQSLLVNLLQEIPQRLDIAVIVRNIRIVSIHPIAHTFGQIDPFLCIFHDLAAADGVVLRHGYLLADVVLGDTQGLLHSQLHGQTMGVPSGLAADMISGLGLVTADHILNRAGHHMMDARHTVGRRRSLEKHILRRSLPHLKSLVKYILLLPAVQNLGRQARKVQSFIFFKHILNFNGQRYKDFVLFRQKSRAKLT